MLVCPNCNKDFIPVDQRSRYCSLQCAQVYKGIQTKKENETIYLLNPKYCEHCSEVIPYDRKKNRFCSCVCSSKSRRGPESNAWRGNDYKTICFYYHKKECVVCGEKNIVAVHHYDENHENNDPKNLIPLCPTHHVYCHSGYKYMVEEKIKEYINQWALSSMVEQRLLNPKTTVRFC